MAKDEKIPSFSEIRRKLQNGEDFGLANRLQQSEYDSYYNRNRNLNRTILSDRKKTREEQLAEDRQTQLIRITVNQERCLSDEQLARQLQEQIDRLDASEQQSIIEQEKQDEELARRLQSEDYNFGPDVNFADLAQTSSVRTNSISPIDYDNMANSFLETATSPVHGFSATNPFLNDILQQHGNQER